MIKAVIFDLDNTLYDYDTCNKNAIAALCDFACEKYAITPDDFRRNYEAARESVRHRLGNVGASHNRLLFIQRFLENIGELPAAGALELYDIYRNQMLEHMQLFPYVIPFMDYLKENNIKVALLTDLTAHIQHRKIKALGLEKRIEVLVTSEEAGQEKPAKVAFDLIKEKLGLPPEEIMMIGDNYDRDICGAINAGMKSLHFKKENAADILDMFIINSSSNQQ